MLKVEPIKKYKAPNYPDKRIVIKNPDMLKTIPQRWKGRAFASLTLSSIAVMLLSGCQAPVTGGPPSPPYFLTEEEAYNVILKEAKKHDISFDAAGLEFQDLELLLDKQGTESKTIYKYDVQLDGYDKDKKIGFEFIGENDIMQLTNDIQSLNDKDIYAPWVDQYGIMLKQAIKAKDDEMHFEAFYTQGYDQKEAEKKLREQVKSFMEWLKSQGVI